MAHTVLITGATGTLGHCVVPEAVDAGHQVRALSRKNRVGYTGVRWAQGDLLAGTGLDDALHGVDVVVNCATQPTGGKDVTSMANLIAAARRASVGHIVHVSIVGIDRIPLPYYRTKLRAEQLLEASGVGHTVLRATQFHDLIYAIFAIQRFSPVLCALRGCGSSRSTPTTSPRVSSSWSTPNRPGGPLISAGPPCTPTRSWAGCTSRRAAAGARPSRCRLRAASSPGFARAPTWCPRTPSARSASPTT